MSAMGELVNTVEELLSEGCSHHHIIVEITEKYDLDYEDATKLVQPIVNLFEEVEGLWS